MPPRQCCDRTTRGNAQSVVTFGQETRVRLADLFFYLALTQRRDIQRGNTRKIVSRRYIQSINYRKLY